MPKKQKSKGYGYKIEPLGGYDEMGPNGKSYRVTKVNKGGTVKKVKLVKWIKPKSDSLRARALRELYQEVKADVLKKNPVCLRCPRKSAEVHHRRGRAGTLLIDDRFLSALCFECHNFIHAFPAIAKENGSLAWPGEWNTPPHDAESGRLREMILDRMNAIGERIKKRVAKKLEGK